MAQLEAGWPARVLTMQRNWIGRSEGSRGRFRLEGSHREDPRLHHARRYHLRRHVRHPRAGASAQVEGSAVRANSPSRAQGHGRRQSRKDPGDIVKEGFFTGHYAVNPYNGAEVPIWVGNFVLMGYGTGAIMAVPAHDERDFEFCRKYDIPVVPVIRPVDGPLADAATMEVAFSDYGIVENSGEWSGLASARGAPEDDRQGRGRGLRQGRHHLSPQGLGHLAPALLGHADSGDPLRSLRRRAGAGRSTAGDAALRGADHRQGPQSPLGSARELREDDVPEVRRRRRARDRHHGHVHRLVLVLLPLLRSEEYGRCRSTRPRSSPGSRSTSTSAA